MSEPSRPDVTPLSLLVGARIGRYVLLEKIAEGGMGVVYAAFDSELDRKVAIKVLRPALTRRSEGGEVQARLLREAQAMARLSHPNVVAVHDVGTHEGNVFLAMEYVGGGNLKERLRRPGPWRDRLAILIAAGRGLAAAHAAGLIHRDFKPDNVLVGTDGRVRVTDFGIARAADVTPPPPVPGNEARPRTRTRPPPAPLSNPTPAARTERIEPQSARAITILHSTNASSSGSLNDPLTVTGDVLGTIGYMAPEQAFGERVDARSDQFSFSATLYVALYGEKPFRGDDLDSYINALSGPVREPPPGSHVPAWLRAVVVKGLATEPEDRFASMEELLAALERDPALRHRRWMAVGAAAAAVALVAFGYARTSQREDHACAAAGDLAGAWDGSVKDDVRRAFEATAAPGALDSFERVTKALDLYATGWSRMATSVCEASRGHEKTPIDEATRLRGECLDRAKTELHALTSVFRRADRGTVTQSVGAAYGLTSLAWCDDVNGLRASPGLPSDPARRSSVVEARALLAEARSLRLAGKSAESLEKAEHALRIAREMGHRSTEAEALFFVAHNRQRLGDYARAEAELSNAMAIAYGAKDDAVMIRTASDLAFVLGDKLYRPDDAHRILALANGGLERIGGGDELEADVLSSEALLLVTEGYADRAMPMLERVVRIDRRVLGESPTTAIYLNDLGYAAHLAGKNEVALPFLREARTMLDGVYGADKFDSGIPLCNLGAASLALGQRPEAANYLRHALEVFDRENPDGFWSAWTLQYLTLAATIEGDGPRAVTLGRRGLAIADRLSSSLRIVPGIAVATADALVATGHADEALPLCDRALEVQERAKLLAPDRILDWDALRCRGDALVAVGRVNDALPSLERSAALPRRALPWDLARAKLSLARAIDASGGSPARAATLRAEAHAALVSMPQGETIVAADEVRAHARARMGGSSKPGR